MKGLKRFRVRLDRARMSLGGCRELRRAQEECSPFRRSEEAPPGVSFGSWL
jgi:hypothetical protein